MSAMRGGKTNLNQIGLQFTEGEQTRRKKTTPGEKSEKELEKFAATTVMTIERPVWLQFISQRVISYMLTKLKVLDKYGWVHTLQLSEAV